MIWLEKMRDYIAPVASVDPRASRSRQRPRSNLQSVRRAALVTDGRTQSNSSSMKAATNAKTEWQERKLEDVCLKITDGTHKTPRYVQDGIRFISIKNIRPFQPINFKSYEKFITPEEHAELTRRSKPEFDDISFSTDRYARICKADRFRRRGYRSLLAWDS